MTFDLEQVETEDFAARCNESVRPYLDLKVSSTNKRGEESPSHVLLMTDCVMILGTCGYLSSSLGIYSASRRTTATDVVGTKIMATRTYILHEVTAW